MCVTGYLEIDEDHLIINQALLRLSDPKVYFSIIDRVTVIDQFLTYITKHLDREEKLMRGLSFPEYKLHRDDHRKLQDDFAEIVKSAFKGTLDHSEICTRMNFIFLDHMNTYDLTLAEWMQKNKRSSFRRKSA